MKANARNILIFAGIYILIILVSNFIYTSTLAPGLEGFALTLQNFLQTLAGANFCHFWPITEQVSAEAKYCTYNIGYILLNIYFAVVSFLLVFNKKLRLNHWIIAFVFFNLLVLVFIRLRDYLYAGM